jgi:hypothetical protein
MRNRYVTLALAFLLAGCFQAKPGEVAGGGGMETTEGNLAGLTGAPAGARVSLIPAGFDPRKGALPDSLTAIADSAGRYRFRRVPEGRYNLEAYRPQDGTRCFRVGLRVKRGDKTLPGSDTLKAPGRARLRWDGARKGVLLQPGRAFRMDLAGLESDSGGIAIDSLPAGLLPPFAFASSPSDSAPRPWTDSVRVAPNALTAVVAYGEWAHAGAFAWDPARVPPDSLDAFPLLLRLRRPGFDFSEAAAGGSDLRVTTAAGEPLPFAVERWDSLSGRAEIWVKWRTLGTGPDRTLRLFWGNPGAARAQGNVFDTLSGYAGVWHLADATDGGRMPVLDAGGLALKTPSQYLLPDSDAAIGVGQRFDGIRGYAYANDEDGLHTPGPWLASAWVAPDFSGAAAEPHTVLAKWEPGDSAGFALAFAPDGKTVRFTLGFGTHVDRLEASPPVYAPGEWHLLAAAYDGARAYLYWDGALLAQAAAGPGELPSPHRDIVIGARGDSDPNLAEIEFFRGRMDEARVVRQAPSAARLDLEYRTQAPGASSLIFQKLK